MKDFFYLARENLATSMVVASDVYDRYGNVIVSDGTVLTEDLIDKILKASEDQDFPIYERRNRIKLEQTIGSRFPINHYRINLLRRRVKDQISDSMNKLLDEKDVNVRILADIVDKILNDVLESDAVVYEIDLLNSADNYIYTHSINSAVVAILIGVSVGLNKKSLENLAKAAFFADIGKIQIDPKLIKKTSSLKKEEFEEIKKYTLYGYKFMRAFEEFNEEVLQGILQSREKWDGTGYPFGLKGNEISQIGQIVAFSTCFDALTSNRYYKAATDPYTAMQKMANLENKEFSSDLIKKAVSILGFYNEGMLLELKNGEIARVSQKNRYKPKLSIIHDPKVSHLAHIYEIDMKKNPAVKIKEIVLRSELSKLLIK